MSINIQLDGCSTGASYCGPVELVAADREGPSVVCLHADVHHTSHFVTRLSRGRASRMLSRYTLCQSLHHPHSRYRVTGIIWTRGHCRQLRHKAVCRSEGWRTKRSSDYVKLSTVCCCWLRPGVPHTLIHQGWISGCLKGRSKGPQKRTTKTSKDLKKSVQKH